MATSKVEIVNRALTLLGARPITNLSDDTLEAQVANRIYDSSLRDILDECRWNFATKRAVLGQLDETPVWYDNSMAYVFQLPSDYIRMYEFKPTYATYRQEGDKIICDTSEFGILYVYFLDDPTKYNPKFVAAFADKLAADMSYWINNSKTSTEMLIEKYEGHSLPKAMAVNSQVGTPPLPNDNLWADAKYGYRPLDAGGDAIA